ncbi:CBS domain-containing protein [Maricaulis sp.]|uniref:CBS domain-containing protein n=1 Tax=Maricaulis sp. TaxID=1486257 RepID=UPI0025BAE603|nr:CBS domain-containing protein [Maricaulis sp.]
MIVEAILKTKGRDVITIRDGATLEEAARLLDAHGIGALLVEDGQGRPVAVLSERDIVREMALNGAACLHRPVAQALTRAFVTAGRTAGLNDLMVLMTERRVRHVPILDGDALLGIISIGDVVKAKIADMEAETAALQAYIRS